MVLLGICTAGLWYNTYCSTYNVLGKKILARSLQYICTAGTDDSTNKKIVHLLLQYPTALLLQHRQCTGAGAVQNQIVYYLTYTEPLI
jgi:hypothetical protein